MAAAYSKTSGRKNISQASVGSQFNSYEPKKVELFVLQRR